MAQLVDVPAAVEARVAYWRQRFARGPWNWILSEDLNHLRNLGFPNQTKCISIVSASAQFRVVHGPGGLTHQTLQKRIASINRNHSRCKDILRIVAHRRWAEFAPTQTLLRNVARLEGMGITCTSVRRRICDQLTLSSEEGAEMRKHAEIRKKFQRTTTELLISAEVPYDWEGRIRSKLEKLLTKGASSEPIGRLHAVWCMRNLQIVCKRFPPRVAFACLHTIFNGWCTGSRFGLRRTCPLCVACGALGVHGKDELGHMPYCVVTRKIKLLLGIELDDWGLKYMVLAVKGLSVESIGKIALLNFAVYTLYNSVRHTPWGRNIEDLLASASVYINDITCTDRRARKSARTHP